MRHSTHLDPSCNAVVLNRHAALVSAVTARDYHKRCFREYWSKAHGLSEQQSTLFTLVRTRERGGGSGNATP